MTVSFLLVWFVVSTESALANTNQRCLNECVNSCVTGACSSPEVVKNGWQQACVQGCPSKCSLMCTDGDYKNNCKNGDCGQNESGEIVTDAELKQGKTYEQRSEDQNGDGNKGSSKANLNGVITKTLDSNLYRMIGNGKRECLDDEYFCGGDVLAGKSFCLKKSANLTCNQASYQVLGYSVTVSCWKQSGDKTTTKDSSDDYCKYGEDRNGNGYPDIIGYSNLGNSPSNAYMYNCTWEEMSGNIANKGCNRRGVYLGVIKSLKECPWPEVACGVYQCDTVSGFSASRYYTNGCSSSIPNQVISSVINEQSEVRIEASAPSCNDLCNNNCSSGLACVNVGGENRCRLPENPSSPTCQPISQSANFEIEKSVLGNALYFLGDVVVFRIRLANTGNTTFTNIAFRDQFDGSILRYVSGSVTKKDSSNSILSSVSDLNSIATFLSNSFVISNLSATSLGVLAPGQYFEFDLRYVVNAPSGGQPTCNVAFARPRDLPEKSDDACLTTRNRDTDI